jgi:hypothetical protein
VQQEMKQWWHRRLHTVPATWNQSSSRAWSATDGASSMTASSTLPNAYVPLGVRKEGCGGRRRTGPFGTGPTRPSPMQTPPPVGKFPLHRRVVSK